jgi:hypothetical protein
MKKMIAIALLSLTGTSAFSAPAKVITGQAAIKQISSSLFDNHIEGTLPDNKSCLMSFLKQQDGSLIISISSGVMAVQLASVTISPSAQVSTVRFGNSGSGGTAYTFKQGSVPTRVSIRGYEDISSIDLTIEAQGKKTTCRYQE